MDNYSVLMSVYDKVVPEELDVSIGSMVNQTVAPEQFVIVWDGQVRQQLREIVRKYQIQHPDLFTFVQLERNMGLAYALNAGLEVCRNELVARMDSDDYSVSTRCEKQLLAFDKNPDLALLGTLVQNFVGAPDNIVGTAKTRPIDLESIKKVIRRYSPFSHPSVMYRKSIVAAVGSYDSQLRRRQDFDLFSRIVNSGYVAENLNEVLLLFRADENYHTRNKNKESCKSRIIVQKKIYKRGHCSLSDYLFIWFSMKISMIMPARLYKTLSIILKKRIGKN